MTTDEDELRGALIGFGDAMLPLIEFAEGQRATLLDRGWSPELAEQHGFLVLCDLRAYYFAALARNAETTELRTRSMEGLLR